MAQRSAREARTADSNGKSKSPMIEVEGEVVDTLPNTMFLVRPIGPTASRCALSRARMRTSRRRSWPTCPAACGCDSFAWAWATG